MTWLDKVATAFGYQKAQLNSVPAWLSAEGESERYTIPERSLPDAQLELYQRLAWVQIAVAAVAETASISKFNVKQMVGEKDKQIVNHEFEKLLMRPNPLQSRSELLISTFSYLALTGNCYWWLNKLGADSAPIEIWVLPANKIKPVPDERLYLRGYVYEPDNGVELPLDINEVVHFRRWHPHNSFVGLSPIEAFAIDAEGELAMQKWNTNLFAKDNAKLPGALAFTDPIDDTSWSRMKDEINRLHGGTNRKLMMLRNVGSGVNWIPMAMSQNDMQFLQGRTFTKEEIFAIYAPGYASMLAVNATEANSIAGKSTFIGMGVWPKMVQVAEKITNDILPAYGQNIVGEFEDIRPADKLLALQEQSAAERVHTVNEIREKFYDAAPIADERGGLFLVELAKFMAQPEQPEQAQDVMLNGNGQPVKPEQLQEKEKLPQEQIAPKGEEKPADDMPDESAKRAERKAFKAWLKKRPTADIHTFKAIHLSHDELHEIASDIKGVATEQPFFDLTGEITPSALKSMLLLLDPDDDEKEQKVRDELEKRTARNIDKAFTDMVNTLFPEGYGDNIDPNVEAARIQRAFREEQALRDAISRGLIDGVDLGVSVAINQLESGLGFGFDWTLSHAQAREWAHRYTDEILQQLGTTSGRVTGQALTRWIDNGESLQVLINDLEPVFGRRRAASIAATEVTRAYSNGTREAYRESGVIQKLEYRASRDELVCPICGPLHGQRTDINGTFNGLYPPVHPNCILPGNVVFAPGGIDAMAKSFYVGGCVEITLSDGSSITVTKNHPVLTSSGFVAAKFINKGMNIVSAINCDGVADTVNPNNKYMPAAIEQVFNSFVEGSNVRFARVPLSAEDLHGDGEFIKGDIDVVYASRLLLSDFMPEGGYEVSQDVFANRSEIPSVSFSSQGVGDFGLNGGDSAFVGTMSIGQHGGSANLVSTCPSCGHTLRSASSGNIRLGQPATNYEAVDTRLDTKGLFGLAIDVTANDAFSVGQVDFIAPNGDTISFENAQDDLNADVEIIGKFIGRFSSDVASNKVIDVREFDFSGHVYDLQSDMYQLYICNGVIVKNCRCWVVPVVEDAPK